MEGRGYNQGLPPVAYGSRGQLILTLRYRRPALINASMTTHD